MFSSWHFAAVLHTLMHASQSDVDSQQTSEQQQQEEYITITTNYCGKICYRLGSQTKIDIDLQRLLLAEDVAIQFFSTSG